MKSTYRTTAALLVMLVAAFSASSQENTKPQTTDQSADIKTTNQDYVFPTPRKRFNRYVSSTVGPIRLLRTGVSAGLDQWNDKPEEWGQGAKGYGKRFASSFGQNAIQQTVTYGLDVALQLDTGFEKSKQKRFFPRLKDALVQNVTSRTKSGKRVISVPRLAGVYAGGVVPTETWYPSRYSYKDGLRHGTKSLLTGFGFNLLREFVVKW
jgi:hypothetical protein